MPTIHFTLNGRPTAADYEDGMQLLEVLREECGVVSPKDGCAPQGYCGCCTVLIDGRPLMACRHEPGHVEGKAVVTLEGLPEAQREVLARAFVGEGAVQCGFCIPGIVTRAAALLDGGRARDRTAVVNALSAHLCRCTGFNRIADAVVAAGEAWEARGDGGAQAGNGGGAGGNGHGHAGDAGEPSAPRAERRYLFGGPNGVESRTLPASGVGSASPRYQGDAHVLGSKDYIGDLRVDGMLHGALVLSEHPRAKVVKIDSAPALAMPGVLRVLTAADVPGERFVGLIVKDWPLFIAPGETTRCVGDVLAMVVADSEFHARRAASAVAVDYEVLEPVTDPEAALAPDAPAIHPKGNLLETCQFARGDVDGALAASAHVFERTFVTQRIEHAFLEPEACLAVPPPADAPGARRRPAQGLLAGPGGARRPAPDRRHPRRRDGADRGRAGHLRRRLRRQGGPVDPGAHRARRHPPRPAGAHRAHPRAVAPPPPQAPPDHPPLRGRRRRRRQADGGQGADRRRHRRLRLGGDEGARARRRPLLRRLPGPGGRRGGQDRLHQQPAQRRHARLRRQPGRLRHRGDARPGGRGGGDRRLRRARAQRPRPRRPLRHRPVDDRELRRAPHPGGGPRRLQGRPLRRHRLRHQEHRHRQRHGGRRSGAAAGAPRRAARGRDRLHRDGPRPVHRAAPGGVRGDRHRAGADGGEDAQRRRGSSAA